ncbi:MAG: hypothetical protein IKE22_00105 [Atopobiaceae bacterium]|nr:hypothetical protein [Atopobiaceae bacterium]
MLTPVDDLPPNIGRLSEPFAAKDVRAFQRRDLDVAICEIEGKKPEAIRKSAMSYIKRHGIRDIEAVQRGGKCYLVRIPNTIR